MFSPSAQTSMAVCLLAVGKADIEHAKRTQCVLGLTKHHSWAQWFEPEACANVARNRPPFSRKLVLLHRAAR